MILQIIGGILLILILVFMIRLVIKKYWIGRKFKRGISLHITLSYRCTRSCDYCSLKMGGKVWPKAAEKPWTFWIDCIKSFPVKVGEVIISGGEPTIYEGFYALTKALLDEGYLIQLYTNLADVEIINLLPDSSRMFIFATFHHKNDVEKWDRDFKKLKFQKVALELVDGVLPYSRVIPFETDNFRKEQLRVNPQGVIFTTCGDRNNHDL